MSKLKKPEWRIYCFPDIVDSLGITSHPGHIMFKHMRSGITLKVPVGPGFIVSEMGITTTINQANVFMDKFGDEIISQYKLTPPKLCISQIANYDDFMLAKNGVKITQQIKPKGETI